MHRVGATAHISPCLSRLVPCRDLLCAVCLHRSFGLELEEKSQRQLDNNINNTISPTQPLNPYSAAAASPIACEAAKMSSSSNHIKEVISVEADQVGKPVDGGAAATSADYARNKEDGHSGRSEHAEEA